MEAWEAWTSLKKITLPHKSTAAIYRKSQIKTLGISQVFGTKRPKPSDSIYTHRHFINVKSIYYMNFMTDQLRYRINPVTAPDPNFTTDIS